MDSDNLIGFWSEDNGTRLSVTSISQHIQVWLTALFSGEGKLLAFSPSQLKPLNHLHIQRRKAQKEHQKDLFCFGIFFQILFLSPQGTGTNSRANDACRRSPWTRPLVPVVVSGWQTDTDIKPFHYVLHPPLLTHHVHYWSNCRGQKPLHAFILANQR